MSTFQLILALIGSFAILVFVVLQKWRAYRTQRQIKKAFSPRNNDVLMGRQVAASSIDVDKELANSPSTIWGSVETIDLNRVAKISPASARSFAPIASNQEAMNLDLPFENTDPLLARGQKARAAMMHPEFEQSARVQMQNPSDEQGRDSVHEKITTETHQTTQDQTTQTLNQTPDAFASDSHLAPQIKKTEPESASKNLPPLVMPASVTEASPSKPLSIEKSLSVDAWNKNTTDEWHQGAFSPVITEQVDCIAHMMFVRPVRGNRILSYAVRPIGGKTTLLEACSVDGDWASVVEDKGYTELRYGIPYANKSSALNEIEFSEWVFSLRQISKGLGGQLSLPSLADVHARAKVLFRFITEYSQELALNLRPREKLIKQRWNLESVVTVLMQQDFIEVGQDRFEIRDHDGERLYQLHLTSKEDIVLRMTLLQNIAQVSADRGAFEHLLSTAEWLCKRLDGVIVDDQNKKLNPAHFDYIRDQLKALYQKMDEAKIEAGSAQAQRLFV